MCFPTKNDYGLVGPVIDRWKLYFSPMSEEKGSILWNVDAINGRISVMLDISFEALNACPAHFANLLRVEARQAITVESRYKFPSCRVRGEGNESITHVAFVPSTNIQWERLQHTCSRSEDRKSRTALRIPANSLR